MVPLCSPQVLSPPLANFQERLKIEKHFPKPCKCLQQVPGVPHSTERQTTAASCLRVFCFEFGAGEECAEGLWLPEGHSRSGSHCGAIGSHSPSLPTQAPQTRIPGGPATPRRLEAAFGARPADQPLVPRGSRQHTLLSRPSAREPRVLTSIAQLKAIFLGCKSSCSVNMQSRARSASAWMQFQRGHVPQLFAESHLGFILQRPQPFSV